MKLIDQALAFNKAYKIPNLNTPAVPSARMCVVRQMLIQKQIDHLSNTWYSKDAGQMGMDIALCIYTLAVTSCEFGVHKQLEENLDKIHKKYIENAAIRHSELQSQ